VLFRSFPERRPPGTARFNLPPPTRRARRPALRSREVDTRHSGSETRAMKAVRLVQPGRPLELHDVPRPRPGPGDVLVRVKAAGICHSDAHYRAGKSRVHPLPMTLGHEVAGV